MEIKKLFLIIIFLIVSFTLLLNPSVALSYTPYTNYKDNTALPSGYQRINPKTGEFQPIPYQGIMYTPDNPLYKWDNIKRLWNLWLDKHHLSIFKNFTYDANSIRLLLISIVIVCLGVIGLIVFLRYLLFKKNLIKQEGDKVFLSIKVPSQTAKSAYSTQQLFEFIHSHYMASKQPFWRGFLIFLGFPVSKQTLSLELVSTKEDGIRYFIQTNKKDVSILEKTIHSYIPGVRIARNKDYLPEDLFLKKGRVISISEYNLSNHFSIPLQDLKALEHYDPIAYITGHMTKLEAGEMVSMQVVLSPISKLTHRDFAKTISELHDRIWNELVISDIIHPPGFIPEVIRKTVTTPLKIFVILLFLQIWLIAQAFHFIMHFFIKGAEPFSPWWPFGDKPKKVTKTPKQELLYQSISSKIDGSTFETSLRLFVVTTTKERNKERMDGFTDSLSPFANPSLQSITIQRDLTERLWNILDKLTGKNFFYQFLFFKLKHRLLSFNTPSSPVLSVSEMSDLYHPPYTDITKTEGLIKSKSRDLPAPQSMKQTNNNYDVIVGKNEFAGEETAIGLTLPQRKKHLYLIGKTGTGKTEMLKNMIYQDMVNGKGLALLDPHGDLVHELLSIIPKNRRKDVIFFDPSDRDFPIGLNILSPGITFKSVDDEQEWITSSTITIFQKITPEQYWGPKMEHVLRNATLTTLQLPHPTLWTLQQLLTDKTYQRKISSQITDPVLKQFWQKEFALVGNMQLSSITTPLTERLGHFITTKMSRHILLQQKSTISIQKIMDEGKILLVNLSKGDLGEDQSFFFGTIITSLIWMAAYQRTKQLKSERRDFFFYIDEFQNFATKRFAEISSESRKFNLSLIASHQNIAQIEDPSTIRIMASNADSIICLKAGPDDENFILPFMDPEVEKGDIVNLPPYSFFMKVTNEDSEDAFSGKTQMLDIEEGKKTKDEVIQYSRDHFATARKVVEKYLEKLFTGELEEEKKVTVKPKNKGKKPTKKKGV